MVTAAVRATCLHCRLPSNGNAFCCRGCEAVHRLLGEAGLARYYELGGGEGYPVAIGESDRTWLEPIVGRLRASRGLSRLVLDVQGLHCSACVWLVEELFRRQGHPGAVLVNSSVGSMELTIDWEFPLESFVGELEAFGYRFGPSLKRAASSDLIWRLGVTIAIAMNTMIFGLALYCGLAEGRIYRLFHALDFTLSFVSVLVGGSVFFRSAWQSVRRGVLHLDVPIALGIALAFGSSAYTYFTRGGSTSYFDTLNVFIALMLLGRFLQERMIGRNRAYLLASDGAEGLYARRVETGTVTLVRCTEIRESDVLLVGYRDLVPVDGELLGDRVATFSLDWISGEATPRRWSPGEMVPAGAFCQSQGAVCIRATSSFDSSSVVSLLRSASRCDADAARTTPWWRRLTGIYVASVLFVASASFAAWMGFTHDFGRALDVVAAVLIVTCPCAFGIATPLAYELAQAGLRRIGLFVRTPGFLDRAAAVERVVFDKTGTLTTGALRVENPQVLAALGRRDRSILFDLVVRSSHPKSAAIARELEGTNFERARCVNEIPGSGLELLEGTHVYRLGRADWASSGATAGEADVIFARDGHVLAAILTGEQARPDAYDEIRALAREGYEPCVLSGDSPEATRRMAVACGIGADRAFGARSPEGKVAWLRTLGSAKTLFVGDGLNDSLVADEALCSGTPAIDRPFMAARTDFYLVSPGLAPIREALHMAKRLARVVRMNLVIAVTYNAVAITLAVAGLMTPLLCAVLMPLSSLSTVLATTARLRRKTPWTFSSSKSS